MSKEKNILTFIHYCILLYYFFGVLGVCCCYTLTKSLNIYIRKEANICNKTLPFSAFCSTLALSPSTPTPTLVINLICISVQLISIQYLASHLINLTQSDLFQPSSVILSLKSHPPQIFSIPVPTSAPTSKLLV